MQGFVKTGIVWFMRSTVLGAVLALCACAGTTNAAGAITTPTATAAMACVAPTPGALNITPPPNITLPPQTITQSLLGVRTGVTDWNLCTQGSTFGAITTYMNGYLPMAGWHAIDPKKEAVSGCGTSWTWAKGSTALVFYQVSGDTNPARWHLDLCHLPV